MGLSCSSLIRLDEEKKALVLQKGRLVKENEAKKARLEELESRLDAFVEVSARLVAWRVRPTLLIVLLACCSRVRELFNERWKERTWLWLRPES